MHENENAPPEFIWTHCDSRTQLVQLPTLEFRIDDESTKIF